MRHILVIGIVCFSTACTVGPNYRRPSLATPQGFRAPDPLPPGQADSFADLKWFEVFKDEQLQALARHALERNYDLATLSPESKKLGLRSESHVPTSSLTSAPGRPLRSIACRAMELRHSPRSFFPRKIGISEPPRCSCCPSK
jgi:hypothetical protein